MREELLKKITQALDSRGFEFVAFSGIRSCFDLVAKRDKLLILVKVLENIDGFTKEQAYDLSCLSILLSSSSFVIGIKSKAYVLEEGILYERYGIPTINFETFKGILEESYPEVKKFNKETVNIDGGKMKKWREENELSLNELSKISGISKDTLHRYEHGKVSATQENYDILEKLIGAEIKKPFSIEADLVEKRREKKFSSLGFDAVEMKAAPFEILAKKEEKILVGKEADARTIKKRSVVYRQIAPLFESFSLFILKKYREKDVAGIPVINEAELKEIGNARELLKIIRERSE